jgi:hypothetical protein
MNNYKAKNPRKDTGLLLLSSICSVIHEYRKDHPEIPDRVLTPTDCANSNCLLANMKRAPTKESKAFYRTMLVRTLARHQRV